MLTLKILKLKGFRAYMQEKDFFFDNPAILLFGENHQGKSSTLNAIEWCLFGNECIGAKSGIRERVDWEIPNRNLGSKHDVSVDLELEDEKKESYKISRRWISKTKDELKVVFPEGQFKEKEAEKRLAHLLKSSFRDFLTTVYQHQEAIRAILTQEPRERNDAIDRLLGLSDYRNILSGIEGAKLPTLQRKIDAEFDNFKREIETALRTREHDLRDEREKASKKGVKENQCNEKGVLGIAHEVKKQFQKFSSEVGLALVELRVPERWKELEQFQKIAGNEINRFRSEMPDVIKQKELFLRQLEFTQIKTDYDMKRNGLRNAEKELEKFIETNGNEDLLNKAKFEIDKQISETEKELSETNAKAATISKAMEYLRLEGIDKNICPVCGKETADLLGHLEKEWEEKYRERVGKIQDRIKELQTRSKKTEFLLNKYIELKERIRTAKEEIKEANKKIGEILEREITEKEDPSVLLSNQLDRIEEELKRLKLAVDSKQETLNGLVALLEQVQFIVNILNLEEKKKIVEQIIQSPEYNQMEELKDRMAILVEDIEKIKQAISTASYEEAKEKVSSAGGMIDIYFRKITNNPSVKKINFLVGVDPKTAKNNYEFKDNNGKDLTPILSQGDLNALALSIFLGMACLKDKAQPFGFVMLDDPSQSLGHEHKERLVAVLDEVLDTRMVILSTMDRELQNLVLSKITKAKTKYIFENWTPERGPDIKTE